jgi:PAS domain S-box-containing protein
MNPAAPTQDEVAGRLGNPFSLPRVYLAVAVFWTLLLVASLAWNIRHERAQVMAQAYAEARANINKDITFRRWGSSHGGVYVPVTETQKSIPWLAHVPGRDVTTADGRQLTLLNPATMLRQMMDRYEQDYGIRGRITGLKQLNPGNAPDAWEREQLEAFTRRERNEVWAVADMDGKPHLRYLRAMIMEPGCDKCHAILGYKTGDMRGATGLNLPLAPYQASIARATTNLGASHAAIWLVGLVGLSIAYRRQIDQSRRVRDAHGRLVESEEKHRLLFERSPEARVIIAPPSWKFTRANQAALRLFGAASEAELTALGPGDVSPERQPGGRLSAEKVQEAIAAAMREDVHVFEWEHQRLDGNPFTAEVLLTGIEQGGQVSIHATVRDITEKKRMAVELDRQRDRLEDQVAARTTDLVLARNQAERLARVKSEFLANMSHEIRTPLNAVLGLARIGARDSAGRESHATFGRIQDAGEHLLGVINDILDFSKLDAGKLVIEPRPFALAATLANAASFVAGAAAQKGIAYEVDAATDLPAWVSGDSQRLQQILVNLLSNAVKFTEQGEVRLRVAREGENIYFKVIDTGIGMSAEQLARLFKPFEQADSSTTRKYGGSGLGLAISQNLARLMGGEIAADSAPGAGSAFTLRLPLPAAAAALPVHDGPAAPAARRLAGLRLLAAEDVEVNRMILEDLLVHEGASVVFAEHGQQALERLLEAGASAFDAVLMDIQMPVMDGFEATRRLREIAPGLPVIGLTAHALADERERCLAAGMAAHVTKPIDADLLVAAILRHAEGQASASSPSPLASAAGENTSNSGAIDWPALLARYAGRQAFVAKLIATARDSHQDTPAKLRAATEQGDLETLAFLAHNLKGLAGNLMARRLHDLADQVDAIARQGEPVDPSLAGRLIGATEALLAALAKRIDENGASHDKPGGSDAHA